MAGRKGNHSWNRFWAHCFLAALKVGMIVLNVDTFRQYIVTGIIIIIAAYFEFIQDRISSMFAKKKVSK